MMIVFHEARGGEERPLVPCLLPPTLSRTPLATTEDIWIAAGRRASLRPDAVRVVRLRDNHARTSRILRNRTDKVEMDADSTPTTSSSIIDPDARKQM